MSNHKLSLGLCVALLLMPTLASADVSSPIDGVDLAKAYRQRGQLVRAYDVLRQIAELAPKDAADRSAKAEAAALLAEIDPLIPFVGLLLRAVADDVTEVRIDGEVIPQAEWRDPRAIDPGEHRVTVLVGSGKPLEQTFRIAERGRRTLRFQKAGQSTPTAPRPAVMPTPSAPSCPPGQTIQENLCGRKTHYLWQNAVVDGGAFTLVLGGFAANSGRLAAIGLTGYLLGSPIVHWSHRRVGLGFGSLGIHVGGMLIGVVAARAIDDNKGDPASVTAGLLVGAGAGFGFEALLKHDSFRPSGDTPVSSLVPRARDLRFGVVPVAGGGTASVFGSF